MPDFPIVEHIDPDLKGLLERFFELSQGDLQQMRDAVEERDFDTLVRLGHTARGTGHGYGFTGMGQIGTAIEEAALGRDMESASAQVELMRRYLETVRVEFITK